MEAAVPESTRAAAVPSGMPPFLAAAMNFKLAVDQSGSGATDDAMNDGGGGGSGMMLHGGGGGGAGRGEDEAATESRLRRWTGEEEASIKEPAWSVTCLLTPATGNSSFMVSISLLLRSIFVLFALRGGWMDGQSSREERKGWEGEKKRKDCNFVCSALVLPWMLCSLLGGGEQRRD